MGNLVDPLLVELGASSERPVAELGVDTRLVALFEELQDALEDDFSYSHVLYASRVLAHLMGLMIRLRRERVPEIPNAEQRVLASIRQLKQGLGAPVDLGRLAASASLSTSHYAALFRRLTGSSPGHYGSQLKIHRAAQLLSTTGQSIKAISHLLGYQDPLYFSRAFRRIQGVSPSQFRELGRTHRGE
jgi:AraC-like DNA-binding protein